MSYLSRAPLSPSGARPSVSTLSTLGGYTKVLPKDLDERDVILYGKSAYCVVKKASQFYRGSYITLRELTTHTMCTVRIEPNVWLERLSLGSTVRGPFTGRWEDWRPSVGDVVWYPIAFPEMCPFAIRHTTGWYRTAAPWTPLADVEVAHDLIEGRAVMVRSHLRHQVESPEKPFHVGSVAATRDLSLRDPSVWFRQSSDYWVTNARGVAASDEMIRYELGRGTYEVLRLMED